jgi:hypothetical protein
LRELDNALNELWPDADSVVRQPESDVADDIEDYLPGVMH